MWRWSPPHLTQQGPTQTGNELTVKAINTRGQVVRDPLIDDIGDMTACTDMLNNHMSSRTKGRRERKDGQEMKEEEARIISSRITGRRERKDS